MKGGRGFYSQADLPARAFSDIASKLLPFEVDEVARFVRTLTRLLERVAERDDVEHAAAVGDKLAVGVALGPRMEHHDAVDGLGLLYAENDLALLVRPG